MTRHLKAVCTGNSAQKTFCKVTQFQWIEDVQQILFQRIVLIDKGETDQHVTVNNLAGVKSIAASSVGCHSADGQRSKRILCHA